MFSKTDVQRAVSRYIWFRENFLYYFESPPPNRRHEIRYAKCARQTFIGGGASAAGRMEVYFESPPPNRRHEIRYAQCARHTFICGGVPTAGHVKV